MLKIDEWDVSKWVFHPVSSHIATDKTPMHEMPLIFVIGGGHFLYYGFECWRFVLRSFHPVGLFNVGLQTQRHIMVGRGGNFGQKIWIKGVKMAVGM